VHGCGRCLGHVISVWGCRVLGVRWLRVGGCGWVGWFWVWGSGGGFVLCGMVRWIRRFVTGGSVCFFRSGLWSVKVLLGVCRGVFGLWGGRWCGSVVLGLMVGVVCGGGCGLCVGLGWDCGWFGLGGGGVCGCVVVVSGCWCGRCGWGLGRGLGCWGWGVLWWGGVGVFCWWTFVLKVICGWLFGVGLWVWVGWWWLLVGVVVVCGFLVFGWVGVCRCVLFFGGDFLCLSWWRVVEFFSVGWWCWGVWV